MIHTNRVVTVGDQESIIDKPIVLYRGDREVEVEFELVGNEFMFTTEGNVIKSMNASHGQLVLNTPSGDHMFSELAECHDGKVVFVITKEMIDEFIEIGFYSFQIRLYDGAEMKSRATIPPVFSGLDIRNPIAAEDETNVVDMAVVDYARIYRDQSNEELPTFTWDGEYNKTEWVHHDVITENKMNKIEDAIWTVNNKISESDNVFLKKAEDMEKQRQNDVNKLNIKDTQLTNDIQNVNRTLTNELNKVKVDMEVADADVKNELANLDSKVSNIDSRISENELSIVNIPNKYTFEDLEDFINNNKGKHIRFPYGKEYIITKQLIINNHTNTKIDFNNCTFKIVDNWSVSSAYPSPDISIGAIAITFCNSENISFENLILDGNRLNNPDLSTETGIHIQNVNGLIAKSVYVKSFVAKMFIIYHNTKNINISNVTMNDLGNGTAPCYFFISNSEDGSYNIKDVYVNNEEIINTAQIFYVAGCNGIIENVQAKNVANIADFRKGRHIIKNVIVDGCVSVFSVQKYPDDDIVAQCDVIIKNVFATGVLGGQSGTTGLYIVDCNSCVIENLWMYMNTDAEYSWYGIRLNKGSGGGPSDIKNVSISNARIVNARSCSFRIDKITEKMILHNVKHINTHYTTGTLPTAIGGSGMTGITIIADGVTTEGSCNYKVATTVNNNVSLRPAHEAITGSTDMRPVLERYREPGYCYFDQTLNKPIWWTGLQWVDSSGTKI